MGFDTRFRIQKRIRRWLVVDGQLLLLLADWRHVGEINRRSWGARNHRRSETCIHKQLPNVRGHVLVAPLDHREQLTGDISRSWNPERPFT